MNPQTPSSKKAANLAPLNIDRTLTSFQRPPGTLLNDPTEEDEILGILGKGATSTVFLVRDKKNQKKYAVKRIQFLSPANIRQVVSEIYTLKVLRHANIVILQDAYFAHNHISMKMAYVDGCSLGDLLKVCPFVPESALGRIAYFIVEGLSYLRKSKFLHRDLKPSNILISSTGEVKIADFGMAKQLSQSIDLVSSYLGTIAYMSPEKLKGLPYAFESDIWSFGVILYQCAIGRIPFTSDNTPKDTQAIYWDLVDKFAASEQQIEVSNDYSAAFRQVLKMCLQTDPRQRASIEEITQSPWINQFKGQKADEPFMKWIKQTLAQRETQRKEASTPTLSDIKPF